MAKDTPEEEKKAKTKRPTAIKRDLQNEKRRIVNKSFKSEVRTGMKDMQDSLTSKDKKKISTALSNLFSLMDKGVKRKIFKQNKADRTKARAAEKAAAIV